MIPTMGKVLIVIGVFLVCIGLGLLFSERIPFIGRLPGDIHIKREGFSFYFPITTSIIISIILTIIFSVFRR